MGFPAQVRALQPSLHFFRARDEIILYLTKYKHIYYFSIMYFVFIASVLLAFATASFLPKKVAEWALKEFEKLEEERQKIAVKGPDRRGSEPFVTGDGLRTYCQHVCEDFNRCRMDPDVVLRGECIFVKTDFFDFFAKEVIPRIRNPYIIVSHNGDLSAPDGQDDAPRIGMSRYVTSDILEREYRSGRLLAHHAQNLWWKNKTIASPRPEYAHCLPIGFENRQYPIGKQVHVYVDALKQYVLQRHLPPSDQRPLLLIAFYPKSRVPDRQKVLSILGVIQPKGKPKPENPFYNYTDLDHKQWLEAIGYHKFVLAPFGHGLDTHRISEILLMGGIPVMRRSTISSCYDDSDNVVGNVTRGSLPVVLVDRWEDVTKERLEAEWERLNRFPHDHWDWKRLFMYHWVDRIRAGNYSKTAVPLSTLYTW
jgi:hypothetical protein